VEDEIFKSSEGVLQQVSEFFSGCLQIKKFHISKKSVYRTDNTDARDKHCLRAETDIRWFLGVENIHHFTNCDREPR